MPCPEMVIAARCCSMEAPGTASVISASRTEVIDLTTYTTRMTRDLQGKRGIQNPIQEGVLISQQR